MKKPRGDSPGTTSSPFPLWPRKRRGSRAPKPHSKLKKVVQRLVSIRALIIISVVLLVVIASVISWMTQHFLAKNGINDLSSSIRTLVRIGVQYDISSVLDAAKAVSLIDNGTFSYMIHNASDNLKISYWKHMYRLIQSGSTIGSISYGNNYGDVLGVRKVESYEVLAGASDTDYLYFYLNGSDPEHDQYNYEVIPGSIMPGNLSYIVENYTLFLRPWWITGNASVDGSYSWTGVFLNSDKILTMSLAQPFYNTNGTFIGVLALHLYLPDLKSSLHTLNKGGNMVFIIDPGGELLIDSCDTIDGILATCPGVLQDPFVLHPLAASGGLYQKIDHKIRSKYGNYTNIPTGHTITVDGNWVSFERITDRNLNWVAVIVMDIDSYMHKVNQATTWTIIGAAVFTFVAAVIAFLTSAAVTRPISRTISQMDRISKMDFGSKSRVLSKGRSVLYEINAMERSLSRLRTALSSFEKFVPNNVIKEILSQDIEAHLGVTPWVATVFFCDIEDFTTIAEALSPAQLVELLLDFLQEMSTIILEETRGTIDKFIGDAIMAFWNAPHPVENHPEMACLAAVRCRQKIILELQPKWARRGLPEGIQLSARFGIHTGDVLIGNIGSLERINYTAIGDNVNIAARLETLCKFYHARIIISGTTYEHVKGSFLCRALDRVLVKGKSQPLMLYELVAERIDSLPEQVQFCTAVEAAADLVFFHPVPERGLAAYLELQKSYPDDVAITRLCERLSQLVGNPEQWPGMEVCVHK